MASAYRIWHNKFLDSSFAVKCLNAALNLYDFKNSVDNIDSSYSGFYQDNAFWGKLALGAVELFYATGEEEYLNDAKQFADSAGSDYWWSSSNINSLAHYKLSKIDNSYLKYIENNLQSFQKFSDSSSFGLGMPYSWGTTNSFLGITLQGILFKAISHSNKYDNLIYNHRDFVLGRNSWGLSFIYGVGKKFPQRMHSQVGYFHNGYLPGALTAGPAPQSVLDKYPINRKNLEYEKFNSDSGKFFDDFQDFVTNEPTISGNATAIFVYGFFSNR
ncbi:MAG: glycoside hydrolase family 9 protein [Ignavibacteriales bacterium]|nr:glycoside hydrolase family 9 protein [Ignavibacteriales bacterium]